MNQKESELKKEQERVTYTISEIQKQEEEMKKSLVSVKKEAHEIRANFWEDVRVNLSEPDDILETNISIRQQEEFLREREQNYEHTEKRLKVYDKMKSSPYFARIDVVDSKGHLEKIYLGISSVVDKEDNFLVYDWRSPISSVYYDGETGESTYTTPEGKLTIEVILKRQFIIQRGKIKVMFDTKETIGDEMLQEVLEDTSNTQMKSIVSTIQQEQNQIIRDTTSDLLFVQGAAGSGKTSAILQRAAYLLYRFRSGLDEKQMIIFSPNRLFNHYISNVLPELGEKNMVQTTFHDFLSERLPHLQVESLFDQFEAQKTKKREKMIIFKNSLAFYKLISRYVESLHHQGVMFKDIRFRKKTIISKEEIAEIFYTRKSYLSLPEKLKQTSKCLCIRLYEIMNKKEEEDWVKEKMDLLSDENYRTLVPSELEFPDFKSEESYLAKKIVRISFKKIHQSVKDLAFFHLNQQYVRFMQTIPLLCDLESFGISSSDWKKEMKDLVSRTNKKQLLLEDAVGFLELEDKVRGKPVKRTVKFLFIDEFQDYTEIQLAYLKSIFPSSRFTLLGDLHQAIFSKIETKEQVEQKFAQFFNSNKVRKVELQKSYRSTAEITNFTKKIIQDKANIVPFERHGKTPEVIQSDSYVEMIDVIVEKIQEQLKSSKMIAIIGKNQDACEHCYLSLYGKIPVHFIHLENQKLTDGVMIIPSYLAKGLEFDSVIALDVSKENYNKESERTLLYTICSRAMHQLTITSNGTISSLLPKAF